MHDGKGVIQDRLARISKGSSHGNGHADGASPMQITPQFCPPGIDPFDTVEWDKRTAQIKDENGGVFGGFDDLLKLPVSRDWFFQLGGNIRHRF